MPIAFNPLVCRFLSFLHSVLQSVSSLKKKYTDFEFNFSVFT